MATSNNGSSPGHADACRTYGSYAAGHRRPGTFGYDGEPAPAAGVWTIATASATTRDDAISPASSRLAPTATSGDATRARLDPCRGYGPGGIGRTNPGTSPV